MKSYVISLLTRMRNHIVAGDFLPWLARGIKHRILMRSHVLRALDCLWKFRGLNLQKSTWTPGYLDRWLWACEQTWHCPEVCEKESIEGMRKISVSGMTIYWPEGMRPSGLGWIYNEIFLPRWRNSYCYESPRCKIKKNDLVLDIGACEGFFSLYAALYRKARVVAFEPVADFIPCLKETIRHYKLDDHVSVIECALSDTDRTGCFLSSGDPFQGTISDNEDGVSVKLRSLDSLFSEDVFPRVDFIKMDVEGHEESVVRGAACLIRSQKPRLALAVYHTLTQGEEVKRALLEIDPGYHVEFRGMWLRDLNTPPRPATLYAWPS